MRTLALRTLIGSIALSALTGIYVLLMGSGSDIEGKVLVTALSVSAVSILVMACGAALERRKLGVLPHVGTAAAIAGFAFLMGTIWELTNATAWIQCSFTLILTSAATALACLLSLATLAPRFRWVRALGFFSCSALATLLILYIWEILKPGSEPWTRLTGILAILLGAVTVAVPILHRMSSLDGQTAGPVRHCVACGQGLNGTPNVELSCSACGARFRVEFLEERRSPEALS